MEGIYCGAPPLPDELLVRWNLDPFLLAAFVVAGLLLGHSWSRLPTDRRATAGAAFATLLVAFVSPLCALSSALFSARTVHHLLIILVAAPLLARALPHFPRGAQPLSLVTTGIGSTLLLWLWHAPPVYDLALAHMGVYWLMQASLLLAFIFFWRNVGNAHYSLLERSAAIIGSFAQMGLLGAILTFAPHPLYEAHAFAPVFWGMSPLTDQQLGGLLMWVPASVPYLVMLALTSRSGWRQLSGQQA